MTLFDNIDYTLTPLIKISICFLIAGAMMVVYSWDPAKKRRSRGHAENSIMNYIEVDPETLQGQTTAILPQKETGKPNPQHATLEHLDDYVKELKRYHIKNIDEV